MLALALANFGALATAPAHAHAGGDEHGVREIAIAHAHHDGKVAHDHAPPHQHGGAPGDGHGEGAIHVHGCAQFAAACASAAPCPGDRYTYLVTPMPTLPALSDAHFPPLRPPRFV